MNSPHHSLKLSNLAQSVKQLCGVQLKVSGGYVQPPAVLPANAAAHLEYEGRSVELSLASVPATNCEITPPPLQLGSVCYPRTTCDLANLNCPQSGHLMTDLATYCYCTLPCVDPTQICDCSVTVAELNLINQCPTTVPVLSGCYCVNANHTQITRFALMRVSPHF